MGLPTKFDTKHQPLVSQHSARSMRRAIKVDFSALQPEGTAPKMTFAQDFLLEHSVSGMHVMKIGVSGAPLSANERSESCQQFGFPS